MHLCTSRRFHFLLTSIASSQRRRNELGPVGILVNNAGIGKILPAEQVTEEIWNEFLRVNLTSVFLVTQRVLPRHARRSLGPLIISPPLPRNTAASSARTTPPPKPASWA